jgi:O-antigen/teichoic acid export membrane protein
MYFQSKVMGKYIVFANVISLLLSSIVKVILILNHASLIAFAWTIVFDNVILALGFIYFYIRNRHGELPDSHCEEQSKASFVFFTFNKSTAISLLKDSWPLIFAGIASMINMRVDQVMLGNMTSYEVVGNYSAAVRIAEIWLILPVVIGQSVFPTIISAHKHSLELYRKRIFDTVKYMSLFAVPFALLVSLLAEHIVWLLYGEKFKNAGLYLSLYIWTGLPYVVFFVINQVIVIENLLKWNLYVTIVVVVLNLTLNSIFIPIYQGIGALYVTLSVTYISTIVLIGIAYKKTNIFRNKT